MQLEHRKLLEDMLRAAENIQGFLADQSREEFLASRLVQAAVEREFEIIGEAMNSLLRLEPDYQHRLTNARRIVDFRNLLAHGYAMVHADRVLTTARNHLPLLIREIMALLEIGIE